MGQITSGTVVYGRTVQPAQYESKKAEVTLTFSLAEGEDLGDMLDRAASLAQTKALEMVGLKATVATQPGQPQTPSTASTAVKNTVKTPAARKPKETKVDPKPDTLAATAKALEALDDLGSAVTVGQEHIESEVITGRAISTGGDSVAPGDLPADEFPDTAPEITDEQFDKIGHAFINSGVPGAGKKIRDLRDEWTGKPGQPLRTLPKEKRQAFVDALGKLK